MNVQEIPLDLIDPSFGNDRTTFDDDALQALADSIRANGLAQPITVRPAANGRYQLIAGERRYRAHRLIVSQWDTTHDGGVCPFTQIKALVQPMDDQKAAAVMLAENTSRADLDPIDEARAYQRRMSEFGWSLEQTAKQAGKRIDVIRNRLALLTLRADLQHMIRRNQLTVGYGAIIASAELDSNRQWVALKQFNACKIKSAEILKELCDNLREQQAKDQNLDMFADQFIDPGVQTRQEFTQKLPADPRKDSAPSEGKTYRQIALNQVSFWKAQAEQWDRYGRATERALCLIAAKQAEAFAALLPDHKTQGRKANAKGVQYVVYQA